MGLLQTREMLAVKPEENSPRRPLIEALIATFGMGLFALFAHSDLPLVLLAGSGLLTTVVAITHSYRKVNRLGDIFGFTPLTKAAPIHIGVGCAVGAVLGVIYRYYFDMDIFPSRLGGFIFAASLIGASEEVLFRGYIQGRLQRWGNIGAPIFAAVGHTVYKLALFTIPPEGMVVDYSFLALWTFSGGLTFGILRQLSGNVLPPLCGHMMFDIIVYGENISAPWWVWS